MLQIFFFLNYFFLGGGGVAICFLITVFEELKIAFHLLSICELFPHFLTCAATMVRIENGSEMVTEAGN